MCFQVVKSVFLRFAFSDLSLLISKSIPNFSPIISFQKSQLIFFLFFPFRLESGLERIPQFELFHFLTFKSPTVAIKFLSQLVTQFLIFWQ